MTMIYFLPELDASQVLLKLYCQKNANRDEILLDKVLVEWTEKLVQIKDNFQDKSKNIKNICIKNLLTPLNCRRWPQPDSETCQNPGNNCIS